ncbi:hypothetical protein BWP11_07670 [Aeromonas hydrophila]|nr:hypothetical protein BWP11_07670 [Aeromonas hydrophila]
MKGATQAPFFIEKCFCFNSYYHINHRDYGDENPHTKRYLVIKQRIKADIRISFLNSSTVLFYP